LDRFELADIHQPAVLARAVHNLLGPTTSAVPVADIAHALDIQDVRLDAFDGFEGMLLTDKARRAGSILANTSKGSRRTRFTVAHELGHFLMERHQLSAVGGFTCGVKDMRETREGRQHFLQESQANQFAINLLAPEHLVAMNLSSDPDLRDAHQMRDHLEISLEVSVRRMIDHREEALAAVWSYNGQVRYFTKNDGFPFVSIKRNEQVPKASIAAKVVASGQKGFTSFTETHPHLWIGQSDLELFEQTRVAANGHAVTLLWMTEPPEPDDDGGLDELTTPGFK
jgi:Zn-dependent peptidase ImmA (M78 family)